MIEYSRSCGLQASDARFVARALRDAEDLDWVEGQLEQRKRGVEYAMRLQIANAWEEEAKLYGLYKETVGSTQRDAVFERHGWNLVDSGFRLWGAGKNVEPAPDTDDFLKSKGWNDINSGFRII